MRSKHAVCVIPARGGSKGIPRKNLVVVRGQPLLYWSVASAASCTLVSDVIVSTDSEEIGAYAKDIGALVHWRSADSATDYAPSEDAIREAIAELDDEKVVLFLQATSPIRDPMDMVVAINRVSSGECDSTFSARPIVGYAWMQLENGKRRTVPCYQKRKPRQQEHWRLLEETGSFYAFTAGGFRVANNRLHGKILPTMTPPLHGYQIDEPDDVRLMESLFRVCI